MADFEHIDMESEKEVRLTRSDYAQVVFRNVAETYPLATDVEVVYTVTRYHSPSKRDWIGLYKVGWASSQDHLYYHWAPLPAGCQQGSEFDAKVTFAAKILPKDDGEFYQFCYVTSAGQVRGASTPFQFKHPSSEHFVETEDVDNDIMVIQSRTAALEAELQRTRSQKQDMEKLKDRAEKDMDSYLNKLMEAEKCLKAVRSENETNKTELEVKESEIKRLHMEAKDKGAVHEALSAKYQQASQDNCELAEQIASLELHCKKLEDEIKNLNNEVDSLHGKIRSLEQEKNLYRDHFTSSSDSLKEHASKLEALQCQHDKDTEEIESLREAALHLQGELTDAKRKCERQGSATSSDKKVISDLRTQLQAVNEQLEALTEFKHGLGQQIDAHLAANNKLSKDLEASKSEVHDLKQRMKSTKQQFKVAEEQNDQLQNKVSSLEAEISEKAQENAELSATSAELQAKLATQAVNEEGPMFAMQTAHRELKKRLAKSERDKHNLEKDVAELLKRNTACGEREKELQREVDDLKERLLMGQEEWQQKYIECKKLQSLLKKSSRSSLSQDSRSTTASSDSAFSPENSQHSTSTPLQKTASPTAMVDSGVNTLDISNTEIQQQLADLSVELENRASSKQKYKRMYQQEREKQSYLKQHYHELLESKDATIRQLSDQLQELRDTHAQYVPTKEKAQQPSKDSVSPQPAPRNVKTPMCPNPAVLPAANGAATPGYGNTSAAGAILQKVNNIASETVSKENKGQSSGPEEGKDKADAKDAVNEAIRTFDPLADEPKPEPAPGEPCPSVDPRITRPPKTNLATNAVKQGEESTVVFGSTEDLRGSAVHEPGSEQMDRQATANDDDEKFYDANPAVDPPVNSRMPAQPSCPVCNLLFPMETRPEIVNEHVNTHFASMSIVDAQVPEATPPPNSRKCIMCDKKFPEGAEHQKAYEDHVKSHF